MRSSQSLIANVGQSGSDFWCWKELTRRLQSGQLTQPEATAAIDKLIAIVQPDSSDPMRWGFNFTWAANFFVAADRAKVISGPQYVAIAQACYGKTPRVEFRSSIPAESPSQLNIWPSNQGRALAGMHFTFAVQEISMRGANASTQDILNRPGQGTMLPPDINLLGKYAYLISAPQVPAGNYQIKL